MLISLSPYCPHSPARSCRLNRRPSTKPSNRCEGAELSRESSSPRPRYLPVRRRQNSGVCDVKAAKLFVDLKLRLAGVGHDMETSAPTSHSAHSSLLQHVLLLEQARQQTAMLAGMAQTCTHTYTNTLALTCSQNQIFSQSRLKPDGSFVV